MREPIIQNMLENLSDDLLVKEAEAARLRARLRGFFFCSTGPVPQKLPWLARDLLGSPPQSATPPQINTPAQRVVDGDKEAFRSWKKALESDAQAQLNLD